MLSIRHKISLDSILTRFSDMSYQEQYKRVRELIDAGTIVPVKSAGINNKTPALPRFYWAERQIPDYSAYETELYSSLSPSISYDFYKGHLDVYANEREYVLRLSDFLQTRSDELNHEMSWRERSFAIWGEEKFIVSGKGRTILKHCGIDANFLNCNTTSEPFVYYARSRETPQNTLISENNDPYIGMRKRVKEGTALFGTQFDTLIYGSGKRIIPSFSQFDQHAETYMLAPGNRFYYYGDLDYVGIRIFESLAESFLPWGDLEPFVPAYIALLNKADHTRFIPKTKEGQLDSKENRGLFFSYFSEHDVARMENYLSKKLYIPQEILNITDY